MTTNLTREKIADENARFLRPGRIDKLIQFDYSCINQIKSICKDYIQDNDVYESFVSKIKGIKTTSAALNKFLFENVSLQNIQNIDDDEYVELYKELTVQYNIANNMYN